MGSLLDLLAWPVTMPIKGTIWIANKVAEQAMKELYNEDAVRGKLLELELSFDLGEISEEEYLAMEEALMERLREIRAYLAEQGGCASLVSDVALECAIPSKENTMVTGIEIARRAKEQLVGLTGLALDTISGIAQDEQGWHVTLEFVEMRRIPEGNDMLATYETLLDGEGS
jgi:hypothetical protein